MSELTDKAISEEELNKVKTMEEKAKLWINWWNQNKSNWILPEENK